MEYRWKVLLVVAVAAFMAFLDAPVVSVALPAIYRSFPRAPKSELGWTMDGYFIVFAAVLVVGGKVADRFGRRLTFDLGVSMFVLASFMCAAAPSAEALIVGRVVQALGAALVVPAGQGLLLAAFPAQQRKTAIGTLAAIIGLAIALAPPIASVVIDGAGWRWIFWGNVVLGAGVMAATPRLVARDRAQRGAPLPDVLGATLQAGGLALLVLAILKLPDWGVGDGRTLAAFTGALLALGAFVERCRRHRAPVVDLSLFRVRTLAVANASSLVLAMVFYGMIIDIVLFQTAVWNYSILQVGLTFLPTGIFGAAFGAPAGKLAERHGPGRVAIVGALIAALGMFLITVSVGRQPHYVTDWFPGSMLYSAGMVIALTALIGGAVTQVPAEQYALVSGVNTATRQIGGAIGVALVVATTSNVGALDLFDRTTHAFAFGVAALLTSAAIALLMRASPVASHSASALQE